MISTFRTTASHVRSSAKECVEIHPGHIPPDPGSGLQYVLEQEPGITL